MSQQGILLINLGSPDSTSVPDVRRYLGEFLMDPRVIDLAWPLRTLIVRGFILPFRPRKSAHAYQTIWTPQGAPLVVTSRELQKKLEQQIGMPVELAMRYRLPSAEEALRGLERRGVTEAALVPLFPHYAMSSFETAVVHVQDWQKRVTPNLKLKVAAPYFDDTAYIAALAASVTENLAKPCDHLLFSFHGVPERHIKKGDPTGKHCLCSADCCERPSPVHATCYRAQCLRTAALVAARSKPKAWSVAFQSRLGRDPWLTPFTDAEIQRLAKSGVQDLQVICPAFVADCLETIEEIGMRGRELFLEAGGKNFELIPCLNTRPDWVTALGGIARKTLAAG